MGRPEVRGGGVGRESSVQSQTDFHCFHQENQTASNYSTREREREIHKGGHLEITSTYVRIQACLTIHTYVSTYMQVHTYVRMYLHAYMYVCMHNIPIVYIRIKQNDTHMAQGFQ